ncbi:MAG TPA: glycerophosphodiester phosphodiesterase [Candidatus Gracilibacteria bacterium]|nr:glycerophosphodiester phosphodiesterase [Candidatus Gracilibacteria bacterium]
MEQVRLQIVAHRGGKGPFPENTPDAYGYAANRGCESVEMDVRYNYFRRRFFLAHDIIHHPQRRKNFLDIAIEQVPQDVQLVLEIKTLSILPGIVARAFSRFYTKHLDGRDVVVISFNPIILMFLRKINSKIPRGILCGSLFSMILHNWFLWRFVDAQWYIVNKRLLSNRFVLWSRQRGMMIGIYLVNSIKSWKKSLKFDVDMAITDYPKKLAKLRSEL